MDQSRNFQPQQYYPVSHQQHHPVSHQQHHPVTHQQHHLHSEICNPNQNYSHAPQAMFSRSSMQQPTFSPNIQYQPPIQHPRMAFPPSQYVPLISQNDAMRVPNLAMPPPPLYQLQPPNLAAPPPPVYHVFQGHSQETMNSSAGLQSSIPPAFCSIQPKAPQAEIEKSQRKADQEWVDNWLQWKKRQMTPVARDEAALSIVEAKTLLVDALLLLKELSFSKDSLSKMIDEEEPVWNGKLKHALELKERLQVIQDKLWDPSALSNLKMRLKERQKKRARQKRKRQEVKEEQERKEQERQEIHKIIDTHRNIMQQKVLQQKRKKEMQAEADNILGEVRRKIHDAKRAQECIKVLEKLRQIRKENSQKKGLHISRDSDETFQRNIMTMKELMQKQMTVYEAEEKALKVMLESEREEQRELENAKKQERIHLLLARKEADLLQALFGENNLDPSHPLYFYWQYYSQADHNLQSFLQIRHQWDAILTDKGDDEDAASIPGQWITPSKPSSDLWAQVLK